MDEGEKCLFLGTISVIIQYSGIDQHSIFLVGLNTQLLGTSWLSVFKTGWEGCKIVDMLFFGLY
jgi:hypothetical protein